MRQVYTSVAAAACMRDARKTTSRKLGQLLDGNLLFRPVFHERCMGIRDNNNYKGKLTLSD